MIDKVQKIRNEVERLQHELIQEREKDYGSDADDACILELQNVLTYIDSLQEEPVSEDLKKAARSFSDNIDNIGGSVGEQTRNAFKAGAKWQEERVISKACEWLEEHLLDFWSQRITNTDYFIEEFKQAMEQ